MDSSAREIILKVFVHLVECHNFTEQFYVDVKMWADMLPYTWAHIWHKVTWWFLRTGIPVPTPTPTQSSTPIGQVPG